MNAKDKVDFLNSVSSCNAAEQRCTVCNAVLPTEGKFCEKCGTPFTRSQPAPPENVKTGPVISPAAPSIPCAQQPIPVADSYEEKTCALASGLPDWSIEPPMIGVRKKGRL